MIYGDEGEVAGPVTGERELEMTMTMTIMVMAASACACGVRRLHRRRGKQGESQSAAPAGRPQDRFNALLHAPSYQTGKRRTRSQGEWWAWGCNEGRWWAQQRKRTAALTL